MTDVLSPTPIFKAFTNDGKPLAGGLLYTYAAGTTTPQATYQDSGGTPNANPVVLNFRGECPLWLGTLPYKFLLTDSLGNTIPGYPVDNITAPITSLTGLITDADLDPSSVIYAIDQTYMQTAAELAAGVTPVHYGYVPGDIRRYGAVLNGVTDDTVAVQHWASVGGNLTFPVAQSAFITGTINLVSNTTMTFVEGATISTATNNISMFLLSGLTNVVIRGATFLSTGASVSTVQVGSVYLLNCNYCTVEKCVFNGATFNGIWATAVNYCNFEGNRFINSPAGQTPSSGDINLSPAAGPVNSSNNVIANNFCLGGAEFGIACWEAGLGVSPIYNVISGNRVSGSTGYGILLYMPTTGDSYNQVIGNHVDGVTGSIASNVSSGAGIYVLAPGAGGSVIQGNTVRNCCINTGNATLAPAGIGVNGANVAGGVPLVINGNTISDMTQYWGILITGCPNGASVTGNTVRMPSTQTTIGDGIRVVNSSGVTLAANVVTLLGTTQNQSGITCSAQGAAVTNVALIGNVITGGHAPMIRFQQTGGNATTGATISGNIVSGGDNTAIPLGFDSTAAADVLVSGNYFSGGNAAVISQAACTGIRYSNNRLKGTGTTIVSFTGTNTSSFFDRSNTGTGSGSGVTNSGTGLFMEVLGTAVPAAGTWSVGDVVRNSAPSAAGVFYWINTTAGSPGTFKTISNT